MASIVTFMTLNVYEFQIYITVFHLNSKWAFSTVLNIATWILILKSLTTFLLSFSPSPPLVDVIMHLCLHVRDLDPFPSGTILI